MSVASVRRLSKRVLGALLPALLALSAPNIGAAAEEAAALTGRVTSAAEGPMEGVVVSAKREGSTKTISVVSRADGAYSFPQQRLEPGRYELAVRAVNYVSGPFRRPHRGRCGEQDGATRPRAARGRTRSSSRCSSPIPNGSRAIRSTTRRSSTCSATAAAATRCGGRRCPPTTRNSSRG